MKKLLVNTPSGQQEIIAIGEGGRYFDQARVLWDERTDGPLPTVTLGGMRRINDALFFDQALADKASSLINIEAHNAPILTALQEIDFRTIRPLREGDIERITALNAEAAALRATLLKL